LTVWLALDDPWRSIAPGRLFGLERAILRVELPARPGTRCYGGADPGGRFG